MVQVLLLSTLIGISQLVPPLSAQAQSSDALLNQASNSLVDSSFSLNEQKSTQWDLSLDLGNGHSSNIARFEGSPAADFLQLYQAFNLTSQLTDSLQIFINQSAFLRKFQLSEVDDVFRNNFANLELGATTTLTSNWDLGFSADGENYRGRELDYRDNLAVGLDYQSYQVGGQAFLRRYGSTHMLEGKVRREILRAQTDTFDEFGNRFKNSYDAIETAFKFADNLSDDISWDLSYSFEFREYLERRSRFKNGEISPEFDTDLLIENYHTLSGNLFYKQLNLNLGFQFIEDRIFGAETRTVPFIETSLPFNLTKYFYIVPSGRFEAASYSNFIGDIINDPDAEALRQDQNWTAALDVTLLLGRIQPKVSVRRSATLSNYEIFEYEENAVIGSFQTQF